MISEEREKVQSNRSEYVTYQGAAEILDVDYGTIAKAAAIGVFRTVRPLKVHYKVIPRWEVEALIGWTIVTSQAKDMLDELRRQKANEYSVDGTADHESEYNIRKIVQRQEAQEATLEEISNRLDQLINMDWPQTIKLAFGLAIGESVRDAVAKAIEVKS